MSHRAALVPQTPITVSLAPRGRSTMADLVPPFLNWLQYVRERSPHTVKAYGFDLQAWLAFCQRAGLTYPNDVTVQAIEVFIAWLRQERNASAETSNRHLFAMRTFFRFAIREQQAVTNPAAEAYLLKTERKLPRYLTIAEQERLLAELAKDASLAGRRDYALVALMLFTGLRVSEVTALQLAHVDLEAGVLRVVRGKGGKARELPIIPRLATILRGYLEHVRPALVRRSAASPYFFLNAGQAYRRRRAGRPLWTRTIYALTQQGHVARILGYPIHPHALRHSFASRCRENNGDLQDIQEFLGHADIRTTTVYAHLATKKRNAKLEGLLR